MSTTLTEGQTVLIQPVDGYDVRGTVRRCDAIGVTITPEGDTERRLFPWASVHSVVLGGVR